MEASDLDKIADYWLLSSPEHLQGMGVDLAKLPDRASLIQGLNNQINLPDHQKQSLAFIAEINGQASGHCNVNQIQLGKQAHMHLHIWDHHHRMKGMGSKMVSLALPHFFRRLNLQEIFCEPFAENPGPNKTLLRLGFQFQKTYLTVPGSLNFEQLVNQYSIQRHQVLDD